MSKANKLSSNIKKTKCSFKNGVLLKLPKLKIANKIFDRKRSVTYFGVMLDKNMSWRIHIRMIKNKISKNIG